MTHTRNVRLAGKEWPVPMLTARQNKLIDPLIIQLLPLFGAWQEGSLNALTRLGRDEYAALLDVAFHAIARGSPDLTYEMFLDLPVTLPELVAAFAVIAEQTGIFSRGSPGEAEAGSVLTGTPSSPMSAI